MPCGGIWAPEPGSFWLGDHACWVCGQPGCELFCDEWDTTLHVRCLGAFLQTEEGKCVLRHGHGISVPEREDGQSWPGVERDSTDNDRVKPPRTAVCKGCGVAFLVPRGSGGHYCSWRCYTDPARPNRQSVKRPRPLRPGGTRQTR